MVLNPEVQRTAQEHVDRVTGGDRLPTIEDKDSLPYITAIIREALRCVYIPSDFTDGWQRLTST